jgi:hypothetical protein
MCTPKQFQTAKQIFAGKWSHGMCDDQLSDLKFRVITRVFATTTLLGGSGGMIA